MRRDRRFARKAIVSDEHIHAPNETIKQAFADLVQKVVTDLKPLHVPSFYLTLDNHCEGIVGIQNENKKSISISINPNFYSHHNHETLDKALAQDIRSDCLEKESLYSVVKHELAHAQFEYVLGRLNLKIKLDFPLQLLLFHTSNEAHKEINSQNPELLEFMTLRNTFAYSHMLAEQVVKDMERYRNKATAFQVLIMLQFKGMSENFSRAIERNYWKGPGEVYFYCKSSKIIPPDIGDGNKHIKYFIRRTQGIIAQLVSVTTGIPSWYRTLQHVEHHREVLYSRYGAPDIELPNSPLETTRQ